MNIFAQELEDVLLSHGKNLSSLYGLRIPDPRTKHSRQIRPNKVSRLIHSLSEDITATLNAEEMEALQDWVPLDPAGQEMHRLRAALMAEGVHHLLAGRMDANQAYQIGIRTLAMLLGDAEPDEIVDRIRGRGEATLLSGEETLRSMMAPSAQPSPPGDPQTIKLIEHAMEPAIDSYEQGTLWLEIARDTPATGARAGLLALATTLLTRARDLATHAPTIAQQTPQQTEWLALIEEALQEAFSV